MTSTQLFQALVDGVVLGSLYGLLGMGFGFILGVTGRFHFAFATSYILAVYSAIALDDAGLPLYIAILLGIACGSALGVLIEILLYRPLVARTEHGLLAVFVTSLGVVIVGENVIRLTWGSSTKVLDTGYTVSRISLGGDVGLTNLSLYSFLICLALGIGLWAFVRWARYGRAIRAVRENPDMARAVGVEPGSVYLSVFAIGSALAGVGAVLITQRSAVSPDAGLEPTFTALVVAFLAGLRAGPGGFMVAGLLLGLIQQFALIKISGSWTSVVTFGVLFLYIALMPLIRGRVNLRVPLARSRRPA